MKNIRGKILVTILSGMLLAGCGGSSKKEALKLGDMEIKDNEITNEDGTKGFKGDIDNTNLQTIYEGLTVETIHLVDGDDKKIDGEEVPLNSKFSIVFEGIKSYTLVDGKAFPKLSMLVTGDKGLVVKEEDLLASYADGLSPEDAAILRGTVNVTEPMEVGKLYICQIKITDKNNATVWIESSWAFTVK
ncbi:MAG: hypothetical protein ABL895_01175 [Cyclobacteriaceae bacterium]